ncbi:MAG: hypothetical protein ACNS60_03030 [Candidatus Cyclobacteriaceae bacterium M2_1C_046]
MKKMFWLILAAIIYYPSVAQKVTVEEYEDNNQKGYLVFIENKPEVVGDFLTKYFKSFGNVRYRDNIYLITDLDHREFPFPTIEVYSSLAKVNGITKASVWLADSLMDQQMYSEKLEKLWYAFGFDFYTSLKQQEIDESIQALQFAEKQFQKLEKDSLGLQKDLTKNIDKRAKLEQELKNNALEHEQLLIEITQNKSNKDSLLITLEKIKKLIEIKEREKREIE